MTESNWLHPHTPTTVPKLCAVLLNISSRISHISSYFIVLSFRREYNSQEVQGHEWRVEDEGGSFESSLRGSLHPASR